MTTADGSTVWTCDICNFSTSSESEIEKHFEESHLRTVLDEAKGLVYGDRSEAYGDPLDLSRRVAMIWTAVLEKKLKPGEYVDPVEVNAMMIGLKLGRIACGVSKRDNWVDIAGYADVGSRVQDGWDSSHAD